MKAIEKLPLNIDYQDPETRDDLWDAHSMTMA